MMISKRLSLTIVAATVTSLVSAGCDRGPIGPLGGPGSLDVPNVVGKQLRAARLTLARRHLDCSSIQFSNSQPYGSVLSESPTAGSKVVAGSTIILNYSVGPDGISPPGPDNDCT
jgi:hypothetical protein